MNFDLSEEQELYRATVERFVSPVDTEFRRALRARENAYDRARWSELAELGLIALAVGEDTGGMGGSTIDLALVAEALGKGIAPDPWLECGVLPARLLAAAGAGETLDAVLSGEEIVACALFERAQRYSLEPEHLKAKAQGDGHVLSGEKTLVLGGALAGHFIVSANCEGKPLFFLLPADYPGLKCRAYRIADGSIACELRCNALEAGADTLLDLDFDRFLGVVDHVRLLAGAEMLGLAQRLFDDTLAYVKEREQFGVAIGSFQALQHRLVECYAAIEQSRSMLYRAALAEGSETDQRRRAIAGAKAFIGEQADLVAREAVQMHGGMGITDELSIGHAMKRVLMLRRLFGDGDAARAEYAAAA